MQQGLKLRESRIRKFIIEILLALDCIHDLKIVHRDLKPSNIFIKGKNLEIKIGDFGISKMMSGKSISNCNMGTLCYSSPEVVQRREYDQRTDIWSLGCVIFELCNY
jgi:NIMA (never in mitosis gene a)-related kinase